MTTQSECTICLLDYKEETKKATECNHIFHQECIDRWLETNNTCPLCRHVLQEHTRSTIDEEDPNINYGLGFGGGYGYVQGGSLMQLVAYGASDRMLSSTPRANQTPSPIFYSRPMYGMGSSLHWIDYADITLPQISQLDGRVISHEEARPEQHQPSGSYNYSRIEPSNSYTYGGLLQLVPNGAADVYMHSTPRTTLWSEQTPPRRTHREQQHQQQQSRRSQIKYNNKQNQRRYK
jgi:hypothetical protein